jgi:hypothetical protein
MESRLHSNLQGVTWTISPIVGAVGRVFDRLKTAIAELGYDAVI